MKKLISFVIIMIWAIGLYAQINGSIVLPECTTCTGEIHVQMNDVGYDYRVYNTITGDYVTWNTTGDFVELPQSVYKIEVRKDNIISPIVGEYELLYDVLVEAPGNPIGEVVDTLTYLGEDYPLVKIASQIWFQKNLNTGEQVQCIYGTPSQLDNNIIEKYCYKNDEANCIKYGGLYSWTEAMKYNYTDMQGICPEGYRIPSRIDWNYLFNNYPGDSTNNYLTTGGASNFDMLLSGTGNGQEGWYYEGVYGVAWTTNNNNLKGYRATFKSTGTTTTELTPVTKDVYSVRCMTDAKSKVRSFSANIKGVVPNQVTINDTRDGNQYDAVRIGNLYWMQDNLMFYNNSLYQAYDANGIYYGLNEKNTGVCPVGWRLPNRQDYFDLAQNIPESVVELDTKTNRSIRDWVMDTLHFVAHGYQSWQRELQFDPIEIVINGTTIQNGYGSIWIQEEDKGAAYVMAFYIGPAANVNGFSLERWTIEPTGAFYTFYQIRCVQDIEPVVISKLYLSQGWNYVEFFNMTETDVKTLLRPYTKQIVRAKDMESYPYGSYLYYPPYYDFDDIGNFKEGIMYQILTNDAILIDLN